MPKNDIVWNLKIWPLIQIKNNKRIVFFIP